jgi:hypothetical protein
MTGRGKLRPVSARRNPFRPKGSGRRRLFLFIIGVFLLFLHSYCDEMPESRNSGIGSEVDFLGNELLRQLHENT